MWSDRASWNKSKVLFFFFFKEGNRHEIERKWERQFSLACSLEHCRVFPIESDYK